MKGEEGQKTIMVQEWGEIALRRQKGSGRVQEVSFLPHAGSSACEPLGCRVWWGLSFVSSEVMLVFSEKFQDWQKYLSPYVGLSLFFPLLGFHLANQSYTLSHMWEFYVHLVFLSMWSTPVFQLFPIAHICRNESVYTETKQ